MRGGPARELERRRAAAEIAGDVEALHGIAREAVALLEDASPSDGPSLREVEYSARQNIRYLTRREALAAGSEWDDPFPPAPVRQQRAPVEGVLESTIGGSLWTEAVFALTSRLEGLGFSRQGASPIFTRELAANAVGSIELVPVPLREDAVSVVVLVALHGPESAAPRWTKLANLAPEPPAGRLFERASIAVAADGLAGAIQAHALPWLRAAAGPAGL